MLDAVNGSDDCLVRLFGYEREFFIWFPHFTESHFAEVLLRQS
jgi:hypothetical protein